MAFETNYNLGASSVGWWWRSENPAHTLGASDAYGQQSQHWPIHLGASNGGVAQSCNDLWGTCSNGCGDNAVFPDCRSHGGSCTPYSFMPNIDNQNCDWMDDFGFSSQPFLQYSSEYSYQAFAAKKPDGSFYDDVWILHGCDGAGIQTDCRGDIFYLEHFGSKNPVAPQDCPLSEYGVTHISCPTFYHQGKGVSLADYTCGWWRGYVNPTGIEDASKNGVGAFGPAGDGGDYSESMRSILANCPTCAYNSALEHPYKESTAVAYFTGAAWPWICTPGDDKNGTPYTGEQVSCFCDNEPSNGRQYGWMKPLYPKGTQIIYCGLYEQGMWTHGHQFKNLKLVCDFITLDPGANEARADHRGVELFPTDF